MKQSPCDREKHLGFNISLKFPHYIHTQQCLAAGNAACPKHLPPLLDVSGDFVRLTGLS